MKYHHNRTIISKKEETQKRGFKWLVIGAVLLSLVVVTLAGCGVPESEYEALQADYDALKADYDAASGELAQIREVYPPRDWSSLTELEEWLQANDVSERPTTEYGDQWFRKALEIQEDALKDGYIVSADYDVGEEGVAV